MTKHEPDYLTSLTKQQKKAVTHTGGPLMIVAGAGTGKTTVLTKRIAWLIEQGIKQENILALTFTDKASTDMERRLDELLPLGQFGVTVSTFHGFGNNIMDKFAIASEVGEGATLLTEVEALLFMRDRIMDFPITTLRPLSNPHANCKAMLHFFSRCKDELIGPETLKKLARAQTDEELSIYKELADAYEFYQHLMRKSNFVDYGDLLFRSYELVKNDKKVRESLIKQFSHILVDEYQDTNFAQIGLLQLITDKKSSITVVGDDDQSIYRFRGASTGQMEQFRVDFEPEIVTLTENFRSPQYILDGAYELIQNNNPHRLEVTAGINKKLTSSQLKIVNGKLKIPLHTFSHENQEAEWVVKDILDRIKAGLDIGDHCILVRTNHQSQIFQHELDKEGIPYTTESRSLLGTDTSVQLMINFLRAAINPFDHLAIFFLATSPVYKMPGSTVIPLLAEAREHHVSVESLIEKTGMTTKLLEDVRIARDALATHLTSKILLTWIEKHELMLDLTRENPDADVHIASSLTAFFKIVQRFEATTNNTSAFHFLENIDVLLSDFDEGGEGETTPIGQVVKLLTIHIAKGLEFPVVYMTNLSSDRFPSRERINTFDVPAELMQHVEPDGEHLREERRLMYVAMTRAEQELILTRAEQYGKGRPRKASVFLSEFHHHEQSTANSKQGDKPPARSEIRDLPSAITLNPHSIDDYLTCPLKYRYKHIDRLPVPDEQPLMVGQAMHEVIHCYYSLRRENKKIMQSDLEDILGKHWRGGGFISKEHEQARLADTKKQIAFFIKTFGNQPIPDYLEESFEQNIGDVLLRGRYDAVYENFVGDLNLPKEARSVILDFKTSDTVTTQKQADDRAKTSMQLTLYALAWKERTGKLPDAVGLYFTPSGLFGWSSRSERQLVNIVAKIESVSQGIRGQDFEATPSTFNCGFCPFRTFCPASMARD